MHPIFTVLIVTAALAALYLFLVAPGAASKRKKAPFTGRYIAHRGLYRADQTVPENSLQAFSLAAEHGYGIELDVQLSSDGEVFVLHDETLDRACGQAKTAEDLSYGELSKLSLFGTPERIPLFSEVLGLVGGRVPLIIELKNGKKNRQLCEKTLALLRGYEGDYCIESFNPFIVAWFCRHAPDILRGQLTQTPSEFRKGGISAMRSALLGRVLFNFAARPQFIAHRIGKKTLSVRTAEALGAMKVAWTVTDKSAEKDYDVYIFEQILP